MELSKVVYDTMRDDAQAILNTANNSSKQIVEAVNLLIKCRQAHKRVFVTGAGACALVAKEIAGQALEMGLIVYPLTNDLSEAQPISFSKGTAENCGDLAAYYAFLFSPGDVLIAISASGKTGFIYEMARIAKQFYETTVIGITENADSPLATYSDIVILTYGKPEAPSATKTQACQLAVGHALMIGYASAMEIDNQIMIRNMETNIIQSKKMGEK